MVNSLLIAQIIIGFSIVMIIVSTLVGIVFVPMIIRSSIITGTELVDSTPQYLRWVLQPFPIHFKVYLFEIMNPKEVLNGLEKPYLRERGPYVYDQTSQKHKIKRDTAYSTLSYEQYYHFEFNQDLSGQNDENDEFYVLNAPLQGSFQIFENMGISNLLENVWEEAFSDYKIIGPFIRIKVKNFIFDGIKFCTNRTNFMCSKMISSPTRSRSMKLTYDGALSFSAFGYKQDTHDGEYSILTGDSDWNLGSIGLITTWEYSNYLDIWNGSFCNAIKGRDFTIYPPAIEESDEFDIFSTDLCRVVTLEYHDQHEHKDIEGQRRFLKGNTLSNRGENSCFCTKQTANLNGSKAECLPEGFLDMNPCMLSPVVLSFPHFLWSDLDTIQTVTGLVPEEEKHMTFVTIERNTGIPLTGAKRFQYNMVLRPIDGVSATYLLKPSMVPLLWTDETFEISGNLLSIVEDYLESISLTPILTYTFIGLGILILILVVLWYIFCVIKIEK